MGAAWVFARDGAVWAQQGYKLTADSFGQGAAVALAGDGNTAVIGAPNDGVCDPFLETCVGATWVFQRINGVWTQQAKLVGTGQGALLPAQGSAVAVSADGSTAFIGGPNGQQFDFGGYFVGATWAYALPHFTFTAPSSATSGMPFDFMVSAQDANGLLLPTYAGILHFTSSDSAALLPADTPLSNGVVNLSATLITGGSQTLTATDTANSGIFGSAAIWVAGPNGLRSGRSRRPRRAPYC